MYYSKSISFKNKIKFNLMESNIKKGMSCYVCRMTNYETLTMKCEHNICEKCIYILILYNKNSLEQFMNNIYEEELEMNCICQNGLLKLIYSNNSKNFKIFNEKEQKYSNIQINIELENPEYLKKIELGFENLKQIKNEIFSKEENHLQNRALTNDKNNNFTIYNKINLNNKNKDKINIKNTFSNLTESIYQNNISNYNLDSNYRNPHSEIKKICDGCEDLYSSIYCYDCSSFSCEECFKNVHSIYKKFSSHRHTENLNDLLSNSQTCKIHNKRFVYHCLTCNEFICINCINDEEENLHQNHKQEYISDFFPTKISENFSYFENLNIEEKLASNVFKQNFYLEQTEEKIKEINYYLQNQINLLEKLRVLMVNSLIDFKKDIVKNHKIISYIFQNLYRDISNKELDKLNFLNLIFENERDLMNSFDQTNNKGGENNPIRQGKNIIENLINNIEDNSFLSNLPSFDKFKKEFEDYSNNLYFNFIKNSITHQKIEKNNLKMTQFSLSNHLFNEKEKVYFIFPNNLDSNIYIIDIESKREVFVLRYHEENLNMFKIFKHKNKNFLITSSDDGTIVIWNLCEYFTEYQQNETYSKCINHMTCDEKCFEESENEISNKQNKKFKVIETEEENLVSFTIISYEDNFNKNVILEKNEKKLNFVNLICSYNSPILLVYDLFKIDSPIGCVELDFDIIIVNNYIDVRNKSIFLIGESDLHIEILKYEYDYQENQKNNEIRITPFKKFKKEGENKYFSNYIFYQIYSDDFLAYNDGLKIKFISLSNYELLDLFISSDFPISSLYFLENDLIVYTSKTINFIKIDYFKFNEKLKIIKNNSSSNEKVEGIFRLINKIENSDKNIHSLSAVKVKKDVLEFNYLAIITEDSTIKIFGL